MEFICFNLLIYSNQEGDSKRFKFENIIYQNELLIIITSSSMEKTFQVIDSDIKRYEEIRTLTTGQSEGYTAGCLMRSLFS